MKLFSILFLFLLPVVFAFKKSSGGGEAFTLPWPAAERWKIADEQDDASAHVITLVHVTETADVWTELANMTTQKGITSVPMEAAMQQVFAQAKKTASKPVLTLIEKDTAAEYPFILFTIESSNYKKSSTPESQLWYIIQGKENLYTNFIALKTPAFPREACESRAKFFKSGRIVS